MKKKQKQTILTKVQVATKEVSDAAGDLDELLRALRSAPRAEKTTISRVVQDAFSRLKRARVALADVEEWLTTEKE